MSSDRLHGPRNAAGKQSLTSNSNDTVLAPGKATLTEHLPTMTEGMVAFVKPHAGATVKDGGGYTFRVLEDGNFEITGTPKGKESSLGHVISPNTNAYAWNLIANKLLSEVPPKPASVVQTTPAPAPVPVAPPPEPEPGMIDRAMRTVEAGLHEIKEGATALWDRATNWIPGIGGDTSEGAAPSDANVAPSNSNVAPAAPAPTKGPVTPPKASVPSGPADNSNVPAEFATGINHARTKAPRGDTLDLAMSRAELGTGGTEYTLTGVPHADVLRLKQVNALLLEHAQALAKKAKAKDPSAAVEGELSEDEFKKLTEEKAALEKASKAAQKVLAADIASGREDVTRFYCSGLSMWTLAAAGYDITKRLNGPDGTEYRGLIMKEVDADASGKPVKKGVKGVGKTRVVDETKYVTLKLLVDGDPFAIEIVTRARAAGTSTVEITGTGYQTEHDGEGLAQAARGAAGAFVAAGIGTEVDELQQKPGDFAQSRRTTAGGKGDSELKHRGAGHAWQVVDVKAEGEALFGKPGSPESVNGKVGWQTDLFVITPTTDPRLVGEHTVKAAKRVEAQDESVVADQKGDTGGDGGVQVTGWKAAPDAGLKKYTGYVVFYGRLGTSRWNGWTKATKESAEAAAASTPAKTAPESIDAPQEPLPAGTPAGEIVGGNERLA